MLVDVRSHPNSRFNPHFNCRRLAVSLPNAEIRYLLMGDRLGGRPAEPRFRDEQGRALYNLMAESPEFLAGIERLKACVDQYRVAILCSEENPAVCHRYLLVTRVIRTRGVHIQHIRGDGRIEQDEDLQPSSRQGMLFDESGQDSWKSIRPVTAKPRPPNSLQR